MKLVNKFSFIPVLIHAESQRMLPIWRELVGEKVLIEYDTQFVVNLNREVFDTMFEGQLFEQLGFTLPAVLRTAIMRKDILFKDYEKLSEVINRYNAIISNLSMSEVVFLREHIYDTELFIQMGVGRFTWISFNIAKFCDQINSQLRKLTSIVSQINFIRRDLRNRIDQIKRFNLFNLDEEWARMNESIASVSHSIVAPAKSTMARTFKSMTGETVIMLQADDDLDAQKIIEERACGKGVYDCQGYFELLESSRNQKAAQMKKLYDSLGPVLIKLESLVLGTFTGRSEKMRNYYEFWEEETYKCIVE